MAGFVSPAKAAAAKASSTRVVRNSFFIVTLLVWVAYLAVA
jgi:hypothetical protein